MAEIKKPAASEMGHQVTGKVAILYGTVKAISLDGTVRMLKINSPVFADDHIITGDDGSVSIVFDTFNHTQLDLGRMSNVVIDEDVYGIVSHDVAAEASAEQESIQKALLAGDQPLVLDATAAGVEASAGGDHPVFVVTPDWVHVTPESGAETRGITWGAENANTFDPNLEQPINHPPTITINLGGSDTVYESALPGGSAASTSAPESSLIHIKGIVVDPTASAGTLASGTFTLSDVDGLSDIKSVTINGTTIAIADLGTNNVINIINGTNGTLTITAYNGETGVANYTYHLTTPAVNVPGADATDSFQLTTTDTSGATSTPATLTLNIVDDTPIAHNDAYSVTEDAAINHIDGNVLANDTSGADAPKGFTAWGATVADTAAIADLAKYGTLTLHSDGTWSFDLNNSLPAVQSLTQGQVISDSISYIMHDADGSTSSAALTITINGTNDVPHITTDPGNPEGANDIVHESGLATGSSPDAAAVHAAGTFTVSDPDGLSDIKSVTIDGTTIAIANLGTGNVIHGTNGDLIVTSYDSATGVAHYTYDLTSPTTDGPGTETNVFTLTTSDGTATSAPATITIDIIDDTPTAVADGPYSVTEDATSHINGNVLTNDVSGADTPATFSAWGATVADTAAIADLAKYGTLTLNPDGTWSFDLNNSLPAVQALIKGQVISDSINYTMHDADGDTSSAALTIKINGADDSAHVTVDASGTDVTVYEHGLTSVPDTSETAGNTFSVSATDGISTVVVEGHSFNLIQLQGFTPGSPSAGINTGEGTLYLTGYTGSATSGAVSYSYTLNAALTHDQPAHDTTLTDSVSVTVNGAGGTTDTANLTVHIIDDTPTAVADGPYSVTEDATSHINGNVLTNDVSGADTPATFSAWGATVADAAAIADLAKYGTLTLNPDGTWSFDLNNSLPAVQALIKGQVISDSINYTMHDADGDTSSAALTIKINGADDSAHVTVDASGTDVTVYEHGLTSVPDTSETAGNTFSVSATDGISTVVVEGHSFNLIQLQGFTPGSPSAGINTGEGTLYLTGYTGSATSGAVSYSYTLNAALTHDQPAHDTTLTDSVSVTVNGAGGTTDTANLTVHIIDDTPTAVADGPYSVTEDATSHINGNVLTNDVSGADTPATFSAWGATQADAAAIADLAKYGTLTLNPDGTWSFDLNNSLPAVQALIKGQVISDSINYTMHDADGDTSSAALTIKINGADDSAHVTVDASGTDVTVYEHGLTSVPDTSETAGNTFSVSATDGISTVVVEGHSFNLIQLQGFTPGSPSAGINTGEGTLYLTGYTGSATSGAVSYSYTLNAALTHDQPAHDTTLTDSVSVTVNGAGGTTDTANLTVHIIDDTPTAVADGPYSVTEDATSHINGNVLTNDVSGADTPATFSAWGATVADAAAIADLAKYGTLTLNPDGTWSFDLNNSLPAVQALIKGQVISDSINYTMHDADGDTSSAALTIKINGADDSAHVTVDASGTDVTVYEHGLTSMPDTSETAGNTFSVSATDGISTVVVEGHSFNLIQLQGFTPGSPSAGINTGEGTLYLTGYTGSATSGAVSYSYTLNAALTHDQPAHDTTLTDSVSVTVNGAGGTTDTANLTVHIIDDTPTVASNLAVQLDDDALHGGNPGGVGDVTPDTANTSGTLSHSYGADGAGTTLLTAADAVLPAGFTAAVSNGGQTLTISQGGTAVFQVALTDTTSGTYNVTQLHAIDHPAGLDENNLGFTVKYVTTDHDGDKVAGSLKINVNDDTPTAGNQSVTVGEGHSVGTNMLITLDISGSMGDASGVAGKTRLDLAKDALYKLMDAYDQNGDVMVKLVTFSSTATIVSDHWMTIADAKVAIQGYSANGTTNYDDALLKTMDAFDDSGAIAGGQNVSYFLSDGVPNQTTSWPGVSDTGTAGISAGEEVAWETFVNNHEITSFALGMGTGADSTKLDPIAYNGVGSGNETSSIVVTNLSQLSSVLVGTVIVPSTVTGNIITGSVDVSFGADGPGILKIVSIAHDVNGDGIDEVYNTSSAGYNAATTALTLTTHDGGTLVVNFSTGAYTYTSPSTMPLDAKEVFSYTIADHDGDMATANLTVNLPVHDVLVVGTTANDVTGQTIDHYIDHDAPFHGPITGGGGNDILVGDTGGYTKGAGATANIVFVLDHSSSMVQQSISFNGTQETRLAALKDSMTTALNDLYNSDAQNVKVHLVSFNDKATDLGTFNLTVNGVDNATALAAAIKAVTDLTASGYTNYEAALQTAHTWIGSTGTDKPLASADVNEVIFVSDGAPNTPNSNASQYTDDAANILAHGFTIEAVGISVGDTGTTAHNYLDQVEGAASGSGAATNITTAEQLTAVIGHLAGGDIILSAAGNDNIVGGDGNDIIFGDALFTDTLATAAHLTTNPSPGSGWQVFADLEAGKGTGTYATWTHDDTLNYIKTHSQELGQESGRTGGNDTIDGGPGNDTIYGQEGNDVISGGAGNDILSGGTGNNILTGGLGADTFKVGAGNDHITDYSLAQGDKVDISAVLNTPDADHSKLGFHTTDGKAVLDVYDSTDHTPAHLVGSVTFDSGTAATATDLDSLLGDINLIHHT